MEYEYIKKKIEQTIPKYKGAKFVHNGRSLEKGIDCLGFLILFYKEFGIELPSDDGRYIDEFWYRREPDRYIKAIKSLGAKPVKQNELKPLDLVYFAISRNIITHTGVMISENQFAHMSPRSDFIISNMERHWARRFRGAVRLIEW